MSSYFYGVLGVFLCLGTLAVPADAQESQNFDRAAALYESGKTKFQEGDFDAALAAFQQANQMVPSPLMKFNIALCYERLGDFPEALKGYKEFLREVPDAPNRAAVEQAIQRLEGEESTLESEPQTLEPPTDWARIAAIDVGAIRDARGFGARTAGAAQRPPPKARVSKPLYKQWWFWVIAGVGTVVLIDLAVSDSDETRDFGPNGLTVRF